MGRNSIFGMDYYKGHLLLAYWGKRQFLLYDPKGKSRILLQHKDPYTPHWVCFWDKKALLFASALYWDGRTPTPQATLQLPERAYCMDVKYPLMVVGTADRKVIVVNLTQPTTIYNQVQSTLKYQYRCVACFPDQQGFCLGSIEGAPRGRAIRRAIRRNSRRDSAQFGARRDG